MSEWTILALARARVAIAWSSGLITEAEAVELMQLARLYVRVAR